MQIFFHYSELSSGAESEMSVGACVQFVIQSRQVYTKYSLSCTILDECNTLLASWSHPIVFGRMKWHGIVTDVCEDLYIRLLDISRQLACMKQGSREKYQPIQYCWVHISRLLGYLVSYMLFAYRYPTNLLQHPDRTAFALAALMLSCLGAATYIYCMYMHTVV